MAHQDPRPRSGHGQALEAGAPIQGRRKRPEGVGCPGARPLLPQRRPCLQSPRPRAPTSPRRAVERSPALTRAATGHRTAAGLGCPAFSSWDVGPTHPRHLPGTHPRSACCPGWGSTLRGLLGPQAHPGVSGPSRPPAQVPWGVAPSFFSSVLLCALPPGPAPGWKVPEALPSAAAPDPSGLNSE